MFARQRTRRSGENLPFDRLPELFTPKSASATLNGIDPTVGKEAVVSLPGDPAVPCNQRGHDPDDCDPSCSLYALSCSDCGSDPSGPLQ